MTPEIHLFILWEKAGESRNAVLQRIRAEFEICRVFRIHWSPSLFSRNLSRFYGQNLPSGCGKENDCGTGPFTLIVVRDDRPSYALRNTTRGAAHVNTRTFDLKSFFRSAESGYLPIHATDTHRETSHDLTMLLGIGPARFAEIYPGSWNGEILPLHQDVIGARGWESIDKLFFVLNETLDYVVLRNFECLPDQYHMESHGDIDLLVGNYTEACLITNATWVFREPYRVYQTIRIAGEDVPFDFRYVGDNYYDEMWERRILELRIRTDGGFFIPDTENHFYSLLYHAAVHKPAISTDYIARLTELSKAQGIQLTPDSFFTDPKRIRAFLLRYMDRQGYRFTRPLDPSVHFNAAIGHSPFERFAHRFLPAKTPPSPSITEIGALTQNSLANENDQRILDCLRKCHDVSSYSAEVMALISDIRSEYLLSPARVNLLRPFQWTSQQRILVFGCGGGCITRFLGETGAYVVAVENKAILADIATERCRDLPNVTVCCEDISSFKTDEKFDCVILIGVLEYAPILIESDDPINACLKLASFFLTEEGALVIASTNKLGLKYFSGCREDHVGIPYFGINDLYTAKTPVTFGKQEITRHLKRAGFEPLDFFYPFPDYTLPNLILSQHGAQSDNLNLADLLIHAMSRNYPEDYYRAFADGLAWGPVAENRLLEEMANSFLICARKNIRANSNVGWLAKTYSRSSRRPEFLVETTIEPDINDNLLVRKHPLAATAEQQNIAHATFRHIPGSSNYIHGQLLLRNIQLTIVREGSLAEIAACFKPWLSYLNAHEMQEKDGKRMLPGNFIDCTPANLIVSDDGSIEFFDAEWISEENIPMSWILIRGITYSVIGCLSSRVLADMTYRQFIDAILGHTLDDSDYALADVMEQKFSKYCHICASNKVSLLNIASEKISLFGRLSDAPAFRQAMIMHEFELKRIKGTVSWQITKPLRLLANLPRIIKTVSSRNRVGGI